ncbi:hypothetical protein, partial [Vibrio parahaemolyticus]|uniref:hypothetical protein n=1 Tax=Vibrio parahaemolyticus TaxID=670 RepID=UPI001A8E0E93
MLSEIYKTGISFIALLFAVCFLVNTAAAQTSDADLRAVIESDRRDRAANGILADLSAAEHLRRADIYMANR